MIKKIIVLAVLILGVLANASDDKTTKKIPFSGNFFLTMSKDDEICRHFLDKFQNDMHKYGGLKSENYDEFKMDWANVNIENKPSNVEQSLGIKPYPTSMRYKIVDLNNDAKNEILVFDEYPAFGGAEEPYIEDSITLYKLSEHNLKLLKNPIKNAREFHKTIKSKLYYISTSTNLGFKLKEFPIQKIHKQYGAMYPYIDLIYDGLRVIKYKEKDYFMMFGNAPQEGMRTIHFKDLKIFDKTMIVISKMDTEFKKRRLPTGSKESYGREDICYYLKVK